MATSGASVLTLTDWAKRVDPDGKVDKIAEILNEENEILHDMLWTEGNLPTGHKTTVRTGLPSVAWRMLNYGVQPSKSRTKQVTDTCGMLETYAEVDKELADLNGNTAEFRLTEDASFLEAMNQEMAETLFYGNTAADPEKFLGLAYRYIYKDQDYVIDGGGTGSDNASIWLVGWGANTVHGIFPKGSKAGLIHEDKGQQTLTDDAGGRYEGYRTHYQWKAGLTVRDLRYVVRICNIDVSDLSGESAANIINLMVRAIEKLHSLNGCKPVFYMNRTLSTFLRLQINDKNNVQLTIDTVAGKPVLSFGGVPVRKCDALIDTEAALGATP